MPDTSLGTDEADESKEYAVIDAARHQFEDTDTVISDLFCQSTEWLQKYI